MRLQLPIRELAAAVSVLLLAAPAVPIGPPAQLRTVDRARYPLARCLDGSAPPFYHRPATSTAAADKWLIYQMGGDFCGYGEDWDDWLQDCWRRSR